MKTWKQIAEDVGVSYTSLKRFRKEPKFPKGKNVKAIRRWLSRNETGNGRPRGKPDKPKAAAAPRPGRSEIPTNDEGLTLREQKLEAEVAKIHQQLTVNRKSLIDDIWEDVMAKVRALHKPLKDALLKCQLTDSQARKISKAMDQVQKRLRPS